MKKGLFLFLIMVNVHAFGQSGEERSNKLAEELGKQFSLSKVQIDVIYESNLKTTIVLDSFFIIQSRENKEGRVPLEAMSIEGEKELERIEKQWRKEVKKIIGFVKIQELKKEERRESKKEKISTIVGQEYIEMFEITSRDLGFLNLYPIKY